MREDHLVSTAWLAEHLNDPAIRLVDLRGYVTTVEIAPGVSKGDYRGAREEYEVSHIPGAIFLDWTQDIVDLNDPVPAQIAPPEKLAEVLGTAGIGDDTLVVAYDSHGASQFATRLWWVFRYYGHTNLRVLDGGWKKWTAEGRPVNSELPSYAPATFTPKVQPELRATAEEVLENIDKSGVTLVDARDSDQYHNRVRRAKHGGHIPGALHLAREEFINPENGAFRSMEELKVIVEKAGITPDNRVIAYCNGGVAATTVLFTLSMLGYPALTNYDGSWNEWGERDDLPVSS